MKCPNCESNFSDNTNRCSHCGFGILPEPKPEPRRPAYLGDIGTESRAQEIAREVRCPYCKSYGAHTDRIAVTGSGITRVFNIKSRELLVASCNFCTRTSFHDCKSLGLGPSVWTFVDIIWSLIVLGTVFAGWYVLLVVFGWIW